MATFLIIRYGEIALKGKNRTYFEKKLAENVKKAVQEKGFQTEIKRINGRIIVKLDKEPNEEIKQTISKVFGVTSFSFSSRVEPDYDSIIKEINKINDINGTFRISVQRLIKKGMESKKLEREIGAYVVETRNLKVDLVNHANEIGIEIIDYAYIFLNKHKGQGGLPLGTQGRAICVMKKEEKENCLSAALKVMRRGVKPVIVYDHLDESTMLKIKEFSPGHKIRCVTVENFDGVDKIAEECGAKALVVPDTVENIKEYDTKLLVLRPNV